MMLAACSSIPHGLPAPPVKVADIIGALHCELAGIYADDPRNGRFFYGWAAGAELNLIVNNTSAGTPGLTLRPPVSNGKLTMPGSSTFSDTAKREFKFRDFISLGALDPQTATGAQVLADCPPMSAKSQNMGIGEALADLARADARDGASHIQIELSNMIVTFNATRSVDGGLTLETSEFTASLNAGKVSRMLENKITITFLVDPAPPPPVVSDEVLFGAAPGGAAAAPSGDAIRLLNEELNELTKDKGIQLQPGDKLVVE